MGEEHARVDQRGIRELRETGTEGLRPVAIQQVPETGARGTLAGRASLQAALLDERAGPRRRRSLQPRQPAGRCPAGDEQLAPRIPDHGGDGGEPRPDHPEIDAGRRQDRLGVRRPGKQRVERRVEVDLEPPAAPQVVDLEAGLLGQPTGQAVVGHEVRQAGQARRPGHRDDIGGVAVVRQGPARSPSGGIHEGSPVALRRERNAA